MNYRTAIFIIPPKEVQLVAGPLRVKYWPDSQLRIPAHISIFSPFVPYDELGESVKKLKSSCKTISPYEITLKGYGAFPGYAYMKLLNAQDTQLLYKKILSIFPQCASYEGKFGTDLHPHLSIAKFSDERQQREVEFPEYHPLKFKVDKLHVMFTDDEMTLPWKPYEIITLGE